MKTMQFMCLRIECACECGFMCLKSCSVHIWILWFLKSCRKIFFLHHNSFTVCWHLFILSFINLLNNINDASFISFMMLIYVLFYFILIWFKCIYVNAVEHVYLRVCLFKWGTLLLYPQFNRYSYNTIICFIKVFVWLFLAFFFLHFFFSHHINLQTQNYPNYPKIILER